MPAAYAGDAESFGKRPSEDQTAAIQRYTSLIYHSVDHLPYQGLYLIDQPSREIAHSTLRRRGKVLAYATESSVDTGRRER